MIKYILNKRIDQNMKLLGKINYFVLYLVLFSITMFLTSCSNNATDSNIDFTKYEGSYFGLGLPTEDVTRFAPDIFNEEMHSSPIFTADGSEVYWSLMNDNPMKIYFMKMNNNGNWTQPTVAPFNFTEGSDAPFISPDQNKMVFLSRHNDSSNDENIWISEKNNGDWSEPVMLNNNVNNYNPHWIASTAANNNIYFQGESNGEIDIYMSEFVNNAYQPAIKLEPNINSVGIRSFSPFIAPDESYLIFSAVWEGSRANLYISYKENDGSWGEANYMSGLNTNANEVYAIVSPDTSYLMFLSGRAGELYPYWVDSNIIEQYRNN